MIVIGMVDQYLPRLLIAIILEQLPTVSLQRRCVNDFDHADNTFLHGDGSFFDPERIGPSVTELRLNPAIFRCHG